MLILENYNAFDGYYFQSGSIRNALDHQGVVAAHTGKPFSEALLFGVSGGMVFGYFHFDYDGYDPQINILTRNTFNLFEPILERLGISYDVKQTTSADKARKNLIDALENGDAPIAEADMWTIPYNALTYDEGMWSMMPLVVYGYTDECVYVADRAQIGLTIPTDEFDTARARIKKDKHRLTVLGIPDEAKLMSAVSMGIWDCIKLYTEKPPRGSANNFGFKAYQRWIKLLTKPGTKASWNKVLPRGRELFAGLTSAFHFSLQFGKDQSRTAERHMMASFLEEAAIILDRPALQDICPKFRAAGDAWRVLGDQLLLDDIPLLSEAKQLLIEEHQLFLTEGNNSTERRMIIAERKKALQEESNDYPLSEDDVIAHQQQLAEQIQVIHDLEQDAIAALQTAMS